MEMTHSRWFKTVRACVLCLLVGLIPLSFLGAGVFELFWLRFDDGLGIFFSVLLASCSIIVFIFAGCERKCGDENVSP